MKLLIDCNEVFDILTRGPFPSGGEHDEAVEHHLRCCHDCRQLAEALRPAVELFHECLSEQEAVALPEYHGHAVPLAQPVFRSLPREIAEVRLDGHGSQLPFPLSTSSQVEARSRRSKLLMQGLISMALTAAVVLTVISLGTSVREMNRRPGVGSAKEGVAATAQPIVTSADAARRLLSLQLPAACWLENRLDSSGGRKTLEEQIARAIDLHELACCTRCHNESKSHTLQWQQVATLQNNCVVCHKG